MVNATGGVNQVNNHTNNNKQLIKEIQSQLLEFGFDLGNTGPNKNGVDGSLGPKTREALQHTTGITTIDANTLPTLKRIATNVQKELVALGYNLGISGPNKDGVDGVIGGRTKQALSLATGTYQITNSTVRTLSEIKNKYPKTEDHSPEEEHIEHSDVIYTVDKGDNFYQIIRDTYNVSEDKLKEYANIIQKYNNLTDIENIEIGQEIKLPGNLLIEANMKSNKTKQTRVQVEPPTTLPGTPEVAASELKVEMPKIGRNDLPSNGPTMLHNDAQLLQMIKDHEGYRSYTYTDSTGNNTAAIGFNLNSSATNQILIKAGYNPDKVASGKQIINRTNAEKLMKDYIRDHAIPDAKSFFPDFDKLPRNAQRIVVNMSYNLGLTKLNKFNDFRAALQDAVNAMEIGDRRATIMAFQNASNEMVDSKWFNQTGNRSRDLVYSMRGIVVDYLRNG